MNPQQTRVPQNEVPCASCPGGSNKLAGLPGTNFCGRLAGRARLKQGSKKEVLGQHVMGQSESKEDKQLEALWSVVDEDSDDEKKKKKTKQKTPGGTTSTAKTAAPTSHKNEAKDPPTEGKGKEKIGASKQKSKPPAKAAVGATRTAPNHASKSPEDTKSKAAGEEAHSTTRHSVEEERADAVPSNAVTENSVHSEASEIHSKK